MLSIFALIVAIHAYKMVAGITNPIEATLNFSLDFKIYMPTLGTEFVRACQFSLLIVNIMKKLQIHLEVEYMPS